MNEIGERRMEHVPVRVDCVIGTRPEAIKMASVVHALMADPAFTPRVVCTGQHREMVEALLEVLDLSVEVNLDLMVPGQTLTHVVGRAVAELGARWAAREADVVLVQGDTGTALAGALAAYYHGVPVGHIEAGLRTFDPTQPFPEETNRVVISRLASMHFCPTRTNRYNLTSEGIAAEATYITGNTGIDSFLRLWNRWLPDFSNGNGHDGNGHKGNGHAGNGNGNGHADKMILVTAHRRENANEGFNDICRAIRRVATAGIGARFIFALHRNPTFAAPARAALGQVPNVELIDTPRYDAFVKLMTMSTLMLTDSGGIQEEACSVGKPTLLLRKVTERSEGAAVGPVRVIGTREDDIVDEVTRLLTDDAALAELSRPSLCFGDGRAAERVVSAMRHALFGGERPNDYHFESTYHRARA